MIGVYKIFDCFTDGRNSKNEYDRENRCYRSYGRHLRDTTDNNNDQEIDL